MLHSITLKGCPSKVCGCDSGAQALKDGVVFVTCPRRGVMLRRYRAAAFSEVEAALRCKPCQRIGGKFAADSKHTSFCRVDGEPGLRRWRIRQLEQDRKDVSRDGFDGPKILVAFRVYADEQGVSPHAARGDAGQAPNWNRPCGTLLQQLGRVLADAVKRLFGLGDAADQDLCSGNGRSDEARLTSSSSVDRFHCETQAALLSDVQLARCAVDEQPGLLDGGWRAVRGRCAHGAPNR
jgi:hypothetical protein